MFIPVTIAKSIADFFGRRNAMSLECIVFIVGVIIQVTAFTSWVQVALGRLISGLGVGALSITVPIVRSWTSMWSNSISDSTNPTVPSRNRPPSDSGSHDVSGFNLLKLEIPCQPLNSATYQLFITFGILVACEFNAPDLQSCIPYLAKILFLWGPVGSTVPGHGGRLSP